MVDTLLQPISKVQKSFFKDTTDFINFIENTKVKKGTFLVSMDFTSLYTNIPQNEGIEIVCKAYENFYKDNPPIPTHYLQEMLLDQSSKKSLSSLMENTTYKPMLLQWAQRQQFLLPIFLWHILKQQL